MEDFLNEIDEQLIQERIDKLKDKIVNQRQSISIKIQGYFQELQAKFPRKINQKASVDKALNEDPMYNPSGCNKLEESKQLSLLLKSGEAFSHPAESNHFSGQQAENCFFLFQRACEGILNTYFPLLMQDQLLSIQTEEAINEKLSHLNKAIDKAIADIVKNLMKSESNGSEKKIQHKSQSLMEEDHSIELKNDSEQKTKKIKKRASSKQKLKNQGKNTKIPHKLTWYMQKWLLSHFQDPYPNQEQKQRMSFQSGLTVYQVNNWFINARERVIKKFLRKNCSSSPVISGDSCESSEGIKRNKKRSPKGKGSN